MDHDVRSLQAFMEARFNAIDLAAAQRHTENTAALALLGGKVDLTNGRVRKMEIAIAVLKFAVFTIGGALLLAGLQVVVAKLSAM